MGSVETLDSVEIFQPSKKCHLYTSSWNVSCEIIFRGILNNPMVKLHSVQYFQWDYFHGIQFNMMPWKLLSHDPKWKIKTSRFPSSCNREKSAYLCQWFSAKAIYVLKKKTLLALSGHILIWALSCGQTTLLQTEHNCAVPYQPKELG